MKNSKLLIRILALPVLTLLLAFTLVGFGEQPELRSSKNTLELSYPEHLTGTFTGGFGEETCHSCHFDFDLNPEDGSLEVSGIPENISPDQQIDIILTVKREDMERAGFQLSARYENGNQAGRFIIEENDRIMFSSSAPDSLQYVQHTNEGSKPSAENKSSWNVQWMAPKSPEGTLIFNVATNAANGDQSEFGDYIYAEEVMVRF